MLGKNVLIEILSKIFYNSSAIDTYLAQTVQYFVTVWGTTTRNYNR